MMGPKTYSFCHFCIKVGMTGCLLQISIKLDRTALVISGANDTLMVSFSLF